MVVRTTPGGEEREVGRATPIRDIVDARGRADLRVSERPRVALVCQLKDASSRLESFVGHHLRVGFDRVYLYFDDCREIEDIERAKRLDARVDVTVRDAALVEQWTRLRGWGRLRDFANSDVQVRQMLNALHCLERARQAGVHWLLHIDSDELFYPGADGTIYEHFRRLDASTCSIFTYYNFEAVPETDESNDPFTSISLFKRSLALVPDAPQLDFWRRRTPNNKVFLFYENGKSVVRCSVDAVPTSVHVWAPVSGRVEHRTNDPRNKGVVCDPTVRCAVLHFPCTDHETLWRKYATLGDFPNRCVANTVEHDADTFHCLCRDTYMRHRHDADGGRLAMRALFQKCIMLDDADEIAAQLASGVLGRIYRS